MNKYLILLLLSWYFCCTGCVTSAYLQSPMHANTNLYKSVPLHSDSIRSATYAGGTFAIGSANDGLSDNAFNFSASIHQAHNFSIFQGYYGLTGAGGTYFLGNGSGRYTGGKFFAYWEASGGLNVAIPLNNVELRVGSELSYAREYGDYLKYRKNLSDSTVNINYSNNHHLTLGAFVDLLIKMRNGNVMGFKVSPGINLYHYKLTESAYFDADRRSYKRRGYYFMHCFHYQRGKVTSFVQIQHGFYAFSGQAGVNIRLGRE